MYVLSRFRERATPGCKIYMYAPYYKPHTCGFTVVSGKSKPPILRGASPYHHLTQVQAESRTQAQDCGITEQVYQHILGSVDILYVYVSLPTYLIDELS